MKRIIICLLLLIPCLLTANSNLEKSNRSLRIIDFSINIDNHSITIGDNFNVVQNILLEIYGNVKEPVNHDWNVVGYEYNGIEITHINGSPAPLVYSIIISDPQFSTSLGISIGDDRGLVRSKYNFLSDSFIYILDTESFFIIQKEFFIDDLNEGDNETSYEGECSKTYSLTFFIDSSNKVSKIILNQAYSS